MRVRSENTFLTDMMLTIPYKATYRFVGTIKLDTTVSFHTVTGLSVNKPIQIKR